MGNGSRLIFDSGGIGPRGRICAICFFGGFEHSWILGRHLFRRCRPAACGPACCRTLPPGISMPCRHVGGQLDHLKESANSYLFQPYFCVRARGCGCGCGCECGCVCVCFVFLKNAVCCRKLDVEGQTWEQVNQSVALDGHA